MGERKIVHRLRGLFGRELENMAEYRREVGCNIDGAGGEIVFEEKEANILIV